MGKENKEGSDFSHFIYIASGVLVLRLDGTLSRKNKEGLEQVHEEISSLDFTHLILNLGKVRQVDPSTYRFIVQLQNSVRKTLGGKVCVLPPPVPIKERLASEGIIKKEEIFSDIKHALESI